MNLGVTYKEICLFHITKTVQRLANSVALGHHRGFIFILPFCLSSIVYWMVISGSFPYVPKMFATFPSSTCKQLKEIIKEWHFPPSLCRGKENCPQIFSTTPPWSDVGTISKLMVMRNGNCQCWLNLIKINFHPKLFFPNPGMMEGSFPTSSKHLAV